MSYVKNTAYVGIAKVFENLISYFLIVLISRYLGAKGLGQYSFIFAFVGVFFIFSDWGLNYMMIKDLSRDFSKVNKYVSNIVTLKTILIVLSFVIYFITIFFIGKNEILITLLLAGLIQITTFLGRIFFNILRIKQQGKLISLTNLLERIIAIILGGLFLVLYKNLTAFVLCLLIAQLIRMSIVFICSKKYFSYKFSLNWKFLKKLIKQGYPFLLVGVFATIYVQLDSIMLSFMKGDIVTGWYNAPYKLINILNIIPVILLTFGFPMFSKLYKENKKQLQKLLEKISYYSLVLILPIVVGVMFLSYRILEFIYKFGSIESAQVFKILIVAELFVFLTTIFGQFIAACDKQKEFMKIAGIGAIINIILNFVLIPKYSLYGAGYATLISYFIMFFAMYYYINKYMLKLRLIKKLILPLIGCLIMGLILNQILYLHLIWIVLICVSSYGLILLPFEIKNIKKN